MFLQSKNSALIQNHQNRKLGFTILEVLITTLIVGISIFALMEAMNRSIFASGDVENYSLALSLTQRKLEEIKDSSFAGVADSARAAILDITGTTLLTTFDQEVVVCQPDCASPDPASLLKLVTVTTYWTVPKGESSISLSTYVVNG